jgi:hypothetical protein
MPIPLGIFATAGAGGDAAVLAYELISTQILASHNANVTFSSIPTDYKHLQLRLSLRTTSGTSVRTLGMRFNGSTTMYRSHRLRTDGGGVYAENSEDSYIRFQGAGSTFGGMWSGHIVDILDWQNANKTKTVSILGGIAQGNGHSAAGLYSGMWNSTSTVTSITFTEPNFDAYHTNSRFSLYGIKG